MEIRLVTGGTGEGESHWSLHCPFMGLLSRVQENGIARLAGNQSNAIVGRFYGVETGWRDNVASVGR